MRTKKKAIGTQRQIIDQKLQKWIPLRADRQPPKGWLKAVRGALGISARQLAQIIGIDMSAVIRLEEREPEGKVTIEMLSRAAQAMDCKLIYAIVPKDNYDSLEAIVDSKSKRVAKDLIQKVEHSMRLESQGTSSDSSEIEKLSKLLKEKMDPRLWGLVKPLKTRRKKGE